MRALVLGGTGFVGPHLAKACVEGGDELVVAARDVARARSALGAGARIVRFDVRDAASVEAAVAEARPDRVYHLAGVANPARSFDAEEEVLATNVLGTLHVLRAVKRRAPDARVLYVGSSHEYGAAGRQPIREDAPLAPVSPYGVSRAAASLLAQRWALSEGLFVVRTRSFNHTGPGHGLDYAPPSFADQLVRGKLRGETRVVVRAGNLDARRDFSGVFAVARAYRALLERGRPGQVVNVCSGEAPSMREVLERVARIAGVEVEVQRDPARVHAADSPLMVGDPAELEAVTGLSLAGSLEPALVALVRATEERLRS